MVKQFGLLNKVGKKANIIAKLGKADSTRMISRVRHEIEKNNNKYPPASKSVINSWMNFSS
jgi:hypothetical protein